MIPGWMDLVIWGHEHECLINPHHTPHGFFLVQPGSTVATSLVEGEVGGERAVVVVGRAG